MPILESIQVGLPQTYGDLAATSEQDKPWRTGFWKSPIAGAVHVGRLNLTGDGQADLRFHGGEDKAILAYSFDHYPSWRDALNLPEMGPGGFGENLSISELTEADVCIGDVWSIGEVLVQVSQPRQPCWKLGRRWDKPELPKLVVKTGRTGWYLRVLREGMIAAGQELHLVERTYPDWTVQRSNQALFDKTFSSSEGQDLAAIPELANAWKEDLIGRLSLRR